MSSQTEESVPLLGRSDDDPDESNGTAEPPQPGQSVGNEPADGALDSIGEAQPPPYDGEPTLTPMTSVQSQRYEKSPLPINLLPHHLVIPVGLFAVADSGAPRPPPDWTECTHPEGQTYFFHPTKRIVTEADIKIDSIYRRVLAFADQLELKLSSQELVLPPSTELMLELDKNAGFQKCRYYFVDHAHRAVFWIDQTDTIKLDLPPVSSVSHLKLLLQQHYWTHVEFFPIHISIPQVMEEELIAILTHASIDASTSDLSTVPYDAEQCNTFLKLIREMPDSQRAMGFRNCVIGRIWSEICANHFVNLRGEPNARLSRNQRLLPAPVIESTWYLKATDKLFFGSPEFYEASISEHWVDKVCYSAHWRKLMLSLIEGWKSTAIYSLMLLVFSAAILVILFQYGEVIRSASLYVAQMSCFVSLLFSLTSFTSSILLIYYHKGQVENSASAVVDYLEFAFHARFGHKPLSILFSIPWGTFIWSLITTGITIVSAATACSISILEILLLWLLASLGVFAVYSIVTFFHIGGVRSAEMRFGGIARVWNAVNRVGQSTIVKRVVARSVGFLRRLRYRGRNVQQRPSQMTEEV